MGTVAAAFDPKETGLLRATSGLAGEDCLPRALFPLDVSGLDDRPPFLDFSLMERGKGSRRCRSVGTMESKIGQLLAHIRFCK